MIKGESKAITLVPKLVPDLLGECLGEKRFDLGSELWLVAGVVPVLCDLFRWESESTLSLLLFL